VELALRLDDPAALVRSSLGILNGNDASPEQHDGRLALAEELSQRSLKGISSPNLADALLFVGNVYLTWGRREEAEQSWQGAKEAAVRSRNAAAAFVPSQVDALAGTFDGQLENVLEFEALIRARGVEVGREQGGRQFGARAVRGALIYLGRTADALAGLPERPDLFFNRGVPVSTRAVCLAHAGRAGEASDILHRMLAARDMSRSDDATSSATLTRLLEAAVILQDAEAAGLLAARLAPLAELVYVVTDTAHCMGRLCGGAAALLGETEKARGYYAQAIEICAKVRFRPELALTRLELAELLLGQAGAMNRAPMPGDAASTPAPLAAEGRVRGESRDSDKFRAEALAHLDFAIAEFREMKMQPSLERALRHKELLKA